MRASGLSRRHHCHAVALHGCQLLGGCSAHLQGIAGLIGGQTGTSKHMTVHRWTRTLVKHSMSHGQQGASAATWQMLVGQPSEVPQHHAQAWTSRSLAALPAPPAVKPQLHDLCSAGLCTPTCCTSRSSLHAASSSSLLCCSAARLADWAS